MHGPHHQTELPAELNGGFRAAFGRLERIFRSRGVPREEAADLAQEAFTRALVHLKRNGVKSEDGSIAPLLSRIAANLVIDRARAAHRRSISLDGIEHDEQPAIDLGEELERRHLRREILRALETLPDRHQHALALTLDGHSPAEIAAMLGIRRNAADALLHRARKRLAEALRESGVAMLGIGALIALKTRALARRASETVHSIEHVMAAASASALNAAAAVVVTIATISSAAGAEADTSPVTAGQTAARVAHVAAIADRQVDGEAAEPAQPVHAHIDREKRAVSAGATVKDPDGREHRAGVSVWHEPREDDPLAIGMPSLLPRPCSHELKAACR